ncbi:hypothetical protein C806_03859 [Lachnospiraceae bacterium 3-1]|nr:hypothetical protein C806_03859 [Lachnospiraceae bacterium 3-1]
MKIIFEEFGGAVVYVIAGGGFLSIFCYVLSMVV